MPIRLKPDDLLFAQRVEAYCGEGLNEPQMAEREGVSVTGLRGRLYRTGLMVDKTTTRRLVRSGSLEPFADLLASGQIVTVEGVAAA